MTELSELRAEDLDPDPLRQFQLWLDHAWGAGLPEPHAMTLATAGVDGAPSARTVLLKDVTEEGFTFFTNYGSHKARELDANPAAALTFHWQPLRRQVCARGPVVRVSRDESAAYWATRPRGSQLGAWASRQSEMLDSRDELEARLAEVEQRFEGGDVPLPDFWGGYRIDPVMVEFWQGRANRLHDRFRYTREAGSWEVARLSP